MHIFAYVYLFYGDGPSHSLILKVTKLWLTDLKEECLDASEHVKGPTYYNFELVYLKVLGARHI